MSSEREFTKQQLSKLTDKGNLHLLIHGNVYDLHEFVNEHPGGDLVLIGEAGKDATKAWEAVEHSDEAKELMGDYLVGFCREGLAAPNPPPNAKLQGNLTARSNRSSLYTLTGALLALFVAVLLMILRRNI